MLQVVDQEEQLARSAFYEKHNIAFVARPPLGRRGVFKKASNLNYQLAVSDRVAHLGASGLNPTQALLKVGVVPASDCQQKLVRIQIVVWGEQLLTYLGAFQHQAPNADASSSAALNRTVSMQLEGHL